MGDADKKFAQFAKDNGYGGAMIWAANPNPAQQPEGSQRCPEVAAALADQLQPEYAWGPAATWTKCNSAGWWPSADAAEAITVESLCHVSRLVAISADQMLLCASCAVLWHKFVRFHFSMCASVVLDVQMRAFECFCGGLPGRSHQH